MAKYVMKLTTGDVWMFLRDGQWTKVHRGQFTKPTSKPVGYIGYGFFPYSKPRKYHSVERFTDPCGFHHYG